MQTIAQIAVALLSLLHAYILVLEMFLWTKPAGLSRTRPGGKQAGSEIRSAQISNLPMVRTFPHL